jgi:hypothetical protein
VRAVPRVFLKHGTARTLQAADAAIVVDAHNEDVAFAARTFEIANVADVESIEAAVGKDYAIATALMLCKFVLERFARNDFAVSLTHDSGSRS